MKTEAADGEHRVKHLSQGSIRTHQLLIAPCQRYETGQFGAIFNTYGLDPGVIGSIDVYNMSMDFLSGEGENDRRTTKRDSISLYPDRGGNGGYCPRNFLFPPDFYENGVRRKSGQ